MQEPVKNLTATDRGFQKPPINKAFSLKVETREAKLMEDRLKRAEEARQQAERYQRMKLRNKQSFFRKYDESRISHYIPAMHMPFAIGSSKVLLYFHANAEDIVLSHELLDFIRALLRVNIIAVEYPGYGIYNGDMQKRQGYSHASFPKSAPNRSMNSAYSEISRQSFGKTPRFGEIDEKIGQQNNSKRTPFKSKKKSVAESSVS